MMPMARTAFLRGMPKQLLMQGRQQAPHIFTFSYHFLLLGTTLKSEIRKDIPFIIMGYLNPIYIYSIKKFAKSCKDSKVSGCIIVDSNNNFLITL